MGKSLSVCLHCHKLNRFEVDKLRLAEAICGFCGQNLPLHKAVTEINTEDFWRVIDKADKPVIVDFWAEWCGPCKMYGPVFENASLKTQKAVFLKVNTEKNPKLSTQLQIRGIPTTVVFEKGKEVRRQSGALSEEMIFSLI